MSKKPAAPKTPAPAAPPLRKAKPAKANPKAAPVIEHDDADDLEPTSQAHAGPRGNRRAKLDREVSIHPKTGKTKRTFCTPEFVDTCERLWLTGQVHSDQELSRIMGLSSKTISRYILNVERGEGSPGERDLVARLKAADRDTLRPTEKMILQLEEAVRAGTLTHRSIAQRINASMDEVKAWLLRGEAENLQFADGEPAPKYVQFFRAFTHARQDVLMGPRSTMLWHAQGAVEEVIATDERTGEVLYDRNTGQPIKRLKQAPGNFKAAERFLALHGDEEERPLSRSKLDVTVSGGDKPVLLDLRGISIGDLIALAKHDAAAMGGLPDDSFHTDDGDDDGGDSDEDDDA